MTRMVLCRRGMCLANVYNIQTMLQSTEKHWQAGSAICQCFNRTWQSKYIFSYFWKAEILFWLTFYELLWDWCKVEWGRQKNPAHSENTHYAHIDICKHRHALNDMKRGRRIKKKNRKQSIYFYRKWKNVEDDELYVNVYICLDSGEILCCMQWHILVYDLCVIYYRM